MSDLGGSKTMALPDSKGHCKNNLCVKDKMLLQLHQQKLKTFHVVNMIDLII